MSLMEAPEYDERGERRKLNLLIGIGVAILLLLVLTFAGYITGTDGCSRTSARSTA